MRAEPAGTTTAARAFVWAGALLFAASLVYFLHAYLTRFGDITTGESRAAPVAWNVAAFAAFAVHHSLFARTPVREWVRRRVPSGLERAAYVWSASLLFLFVAASWRPVAGVAWEADGIVLWIVRAMQVAAVWLTLWSAAVLDLRTLSGLVLERDAGDRTPVPRPAQVQPFKTRGPYGWVRHPIYSAWILLVFSASPMTGTRLTFAVVTSLYLLVAIPLEERTIRAASGGAYDEYMGHVKWRLVPGLY